MRKTPPQDRDPRFAKFRAAAASRERAKAESFARQQAPQGEDPPPISPTDQASAGNKE